MRDQQDAVAHGNATQRDEPHETRHRERLPGDDQREDATDERRGNCIEDLQHDPRRAEQHVEHAEHAEDADPREDGDQSGRILLALELPAVLDVVAFRQHHVFLHRSTDVRHHAGKIPTQRIAPDDDPAAGILPLDDVRPRVASGGRGDVRNFLQANLSARGIGFIRVGWKVEP